MARAASCRTGRVFEKAGVGVSVVHGTLSPEAAQSMGGGQHLVGEDRFKFFATGISLVLHPHNPMAPDGARQLPLFRTRRRHRRWRLVVWRRG